jgi:hypothetical protein
MSLKEINKIINRGLTGALFFLVATIIPEQEPLHMLLTFIGIAIITPYIIKRINNILN